MNQNQIDYFEKKIKKFFVGLIEELPGKEEDGDIVYESTHDVNLFLRMNKECMKILKEEKILKNNIN